MTEEAFSKEDAEFNRQDRFTARREMINTLNRMGIHPKPVQLDTPKGAINASKLKEMYKDLPTEEDHKLIQIGQQFDRPPGTGSLSRLVEEAHARGLIEANADETPQFIVTGKPRLDYFDESNIPKFARHETPKKRIKK